MLLNLLFPRRCVSCNKFGKYFCDNCKTKIQYPGFQICSVCRFPSSNGATHYRCLKKNSLDGVFIGAGYKGPVKKAIHLLKYRFVSDLVREITEILFTNYPPFLGTYGLILPVPLHQKKLKERGFNQAFLIAKIIAEKLKLPVIENEIIRAQYTKPQFGLKVQERKTNVANVFRINDPHIIKGKKIILVDDVATTFSTLSECSKALKINGVQKVWAIVLAHGN